MSYIGTAGWSIPAPYRESFPEEGSHLERYATRLNCVEINSSFYKSHKRKTYERWAASVPDAFRFSVKVPRTITQDRRLENCADLVDMFLSEVCGLGNKLGILLVQLPPSLVFASDVVNEFFPVFGPIGARIACEPRHASWFTQEAEVTLRKLAVTRVAADPPRAVGDGKPGGKTGLAYWRMHGSPKIYYSDYGEEALQSLHRKLGREDWCIFDNTAAFHALGNALRLGELEKSELL